MNISIPQRAPVASSQSVSRVGASPSAGDRRSEVSHRVLMHVVFFPQGSLKFRKLEDEVC